MIKKSDERLSGMTSEQNVIFSIDQSEAHKIISGLSNHNVMTRI